MKIVDKYLSHGSDEEILIKECLSDGKLSGTSEMILRYENSLADFWHVEYAIAVSSGTAAIATALHSLNISAGDEIIVNALAPIMSALPIIQIGAIPVFADCQKNSFDFDYSSLEARISNKTKAIIAVPIYGYPFNYNNLEQICKKHNIPLIEDAAQAHGAQYEKKYVGTWGDVGCFSTHDRKILSTGEGGFILTNRKDIFERAKAFIQFDNMSGANFGTNYKLSALQAAVGLSRIKQIEWQIKVRNENADYFLSYFKNNTSVSDISFPSNSVRNYYSLVIVFSPEINAKSIVSELNAKGIPSDVLRYEFVPLYERKIFADFINSCPNSKALCRQLTTIPVHPGIEKKEIEYMAVSLIDALDKQLKRL